MIYSFISSQDRSIHSSGFLLPCLVELAIGEGWCEPLFVVKKEVEVRAQTQGIYQLR